MLSHRFLENVTEQALVELDLTGTDISEEGGQALLSALRANSALVSLNLMWNDVEPTTMKEIGDMLAQKAPKYNREPLSDEGPKRSLHSSRTTMHEDVDVETDDLELLALQEKERSFKSTVEKETKDAEKSTHWEPPGGSPAGGFQLPKVHYSLPSHFTLTFLCKILGLPKACYRKIANPVQQASEQRDGRP